MPKHSAPAATRQTYLAQIREELISQRDELKARVAAQKRDRRQPGGRSADSVEVAVVGDLSEMDARHLEENTRKLLAIEAALARIEAGRYGICPDCGGEIEPKRLRATLFVVRCGTCAEAKEKEDKQRR